MINSLTRFVVRSGGFWIFWRTKTAISATSCTHAIRHLLAKGTIRPGERIEVQTVHIS